MVAEREELELTRMLELPAGEGVDERLRRWAEAFEAWIAMRREGFHRSVGSVSYHAWRELLDFGGKRPWEVEVEDVRAYAQWLEDKGKSASTVVPSTRLIRREE